jgi:hypothetical protein
MRFSTIVFIAGRVWDIVMLAPLYFLLDLAGRQCAPPTACPQFVYGYLSMTIAGQIVFSWSSPTEFRLLTIPSSVEKLAPRPASVCAARSRWLRGFVPFLVTTAMVANALAASPASRTSTPISCAPPLISRDLRVYLINEAGADPQTLDAAEAETLTIWASAGLRLTWTFPPVPLDLTDGRTVVVIVRRALSRSGTGDAATSEASSHPPLGWLAFGEDGSPGNLIEVSFQAIKSLVMPGSYLRPANLRAPRRRPDATSRTWTRPCRGPRDRSLAHGPGAARGTIVYTKANLSCRSRMRVRALTHQRDRLVAVPALLLERHGDRASAPGRRDRRAEAPMWPLRAGARLGGCRRSQGRPRPSRSANSHPKELPAPGTPRDSG